MCTNIARVFSLLRRAASPHIQVARLQCAEDLAKLPKEVQVIDFVVVPRRRSYWVEEILDGGDRRVIARCPSEDDALERLRYLRARQQTRAQQQMVLEASRFHASAHG
jgi:hypothetical protein